MLSQEDIDFYNNWKSKATALASDNLDTIFNKFTTLFTLYNRLYNLIPGEPGATSKKIPDSIAATELVSKFVGADSLVTNWESNNMDDLLGLRQILENNLFNIKLKDGAPQKEIDKQLLADMQSNNSSSLTLAVLKIIYFVRCNTVHGHKDFEEYQRLLLEPLTALLYSTIHILFAKLSSN